MAHGGDQKENITNRSLAELQCHLTVASRRSREFSLLPETLMDTIAMTISWKVKRMLETSMINK